MKGQMSVRILYALTVALEIGVDLFTIRTVSCCCSHDLKYNSNVWKHKQRTARRECLCRCHNVCVRGREFGAIRSTHW